MATVRGDIHDLGKNIVIMMLRSYGILVHDLGVDVAPEEVVRKAEELRPDIIGLSGLLTVATDGMKATVDAVHGAEKRLGRRMPVIIGGGIVDEQTSAGRAPTCGPTTPRAACSSSARRSPPRA